MSEDLFRIIVVIGVLVAAVAFVVQAVVGLAALRAARAMQQRVESLAARAEPLVDKAGPVIEKMGPLADGISGLIASGRQTIDETRPKLAELSDEAIEIVRAGRYQVTRLGDLLNDAGDRARLRLEQIDHAVDATVEKVEAMGENVKRTVTRPVREVNGMAAAVSAALAAFVKGRKSSVSSATQDEEMFI